MQLVKPPNHHVNAAERAMQTFKNHKIAGLSTCDEKFHQYYGENELSKHKTN